VGAFVTSDSLHSLIDISVSASRIVPSPSSIDVPR